VAAIRAAGLLAVSCCHLQTEYAVAGLPIPHNYQARRKLRTETPRVGWFRKTRDRIADGAAFYGG